MAVVGGRRAERPDRAASLLITLGVVALALGAVVSVARRALFYPDAFSDRLVGSLADPRVAAFVADRATEAVLKKEPDLTAFRPLIVATARGACSSESFQALVRNGAHAAHASLFSAGGRTVVLSVPDVGVVLRTVLGKANPALAEKIPVRVQGVLASIGKGRAGGVVLRVLDISRRSQWLAGILGFGGAALALAGVLVAGDPRRAVGRLGLDLLAAGLVLFFLVPAGRAVVTTLPHDDLAKGAAAGLWDAFTVSLRTWAVVLGGIGLVLKAASHSLVARFKPREAGRRLVAWLEDPPGGARGRALRSAVLIGVGASALLWPATAATLAVAGLGGLAAFAGLREIFELTLRAGPRSDSATGEMARETGTRAAVVVGSAAVLIAGIAWFGRPHGAAAPLLTDACNGAPELCARPLDQIVFPGTHNAMSAADVPEWLFPQQERGIRAQLEDGIRALLLDVHYGIPVEARVKTDLDSEGGSREKFERAVGKEGLDAALRIRDRMTGLPEGPRGLYLCHGFCELGAVPLATAFEAVYEFLVQYPGEVLVLVIEDYVSPQDLAATFAASGLDGLVYRGPAGPWPTLRELIDSRQRVVVLTESGRPGVDWLHPAFDVMQETPYSFKQPGELSCAPNRGGTAGALFLMNNWIDTTPAPKPSNAAIVNAYDALLARARRCEAERGKRPTVIAVDFYKTGAVVRVARALNGLPVAPAD